VQILIIVAINLVKFSSSKG